MTQVSISMTQISISVTNRLSVEIQYPHLLLLFIAWVTLNFNNE